MSETTAPKPLAMADVVPIRAVPQLETSNAREVTSHFVAAFLLSARLSGPLCTDRLLLVVEALAATLGELN